MALPLKGIPAASASADEGGDLCSVLPSKDRLLLRDFLMKRYLFLDYEENFDRPEHPSLWVVTSLQEPIKSNGTRNPNIIGELDFGYEMTTLFRCNLEFLPQASWRRVGSSLLFDLCMKGNVVKRLGLLFAALYLKQCSVHLQRYYGGDEREVSDPPVFVSLSRTGIPTIIPIHHRHIIAGKGERGDRLVASFARDLRILHSKEGVFSPGILWVKRVLWPLDYSYNTRMVNKDLTFYETNVGQIFDELATAFGGFETSIFGRAPGSSRFICFRTGQPLGYYGSWALFSLTHHYIVWLAAWIVGWGHTPFTRYALFGDDIVIADRAVADKYRKLLGLLDVSISESKSLCSKSGALEFAKQFWVDQVRKNLTPLSAKAVLFSYYTDRSLPGRGQPLNPYLKGIIVEEVRRCCQPKQLELVPSDILWSEGKQDNLEYTFSLCQSTRKVSLASIPLALSLLMSGIRAWATLLCTYEMGFFLMAIEDESPSPHPAAPDGHQSALKYYTCRPKTKTKAAPSADLPSSSPQPSLPPDHSAPLPSEREDVFIEIGVDTPELQKKCFSLFQEELDRHLDLLPRCRERNPDEAVLSFIDSLGEELEDELKSPDGGCMHSRYMFLRGLRCRQQECMTAAKNSMMPGGSGADNRRVRGITVDKVFEFSPIENRCQQAKKFSLGDSLLPEHSRKKVKGLRLECQSLVLGRAYLPTETRWILIDLYERKAKWARRIPQLHFRLSRTSVLRQAGLRVETEGKEGVEADDFTKRCLGLIPKVNHTSKAVKMIIYDIL
ncbi:hypothetical protein ZIOFF_074526 (mitochondrion) [Zingiber officinale]|uniref:RNA-dependent RNA polymerase n=1 Tax=Zingiber officinale TaxID=94328 RepID=A0A8J5CR27_ZINOF|nr:hypothetical protein ZIOFF_074526 [Zingiber officinale]